MRLYFGCSMGGDSLSTGKAVKLAARKVQNLSTLKLSSGPDRSLLSRFRTQGLMFDTLSVAWGEQARGGTHDDHRLVVFMQAHCFVF